MSSTAPRTDYDAVQAVMAQTIDRKKTESAISTANVLVTTYLTDKGLGTTVLKEIETYLAAHILSITVYRQARTIKVGDATETYAILGTGLNASTYGQIVVTLDTTGTLASMNKKKADIRVIPQFDDSELLT